MGEQMAQTTAHWTIVTGTTLQAAARQLAPCHPALLAEAYYLCQLPYQYPLAPLPRAEYVPHGVDGWRPLVVQKEHGSRALHACATWSVVPPLQSASAELRHY